MATYIVRVPFTGYVSVKIEADNEQDAIRNALESDIDVNDADKIQYHGQIVKGNVFYGVLNKIEVEECVD
ncbi:hypothetical protein NIES2100_05050 [Calothrix sp. NIES-2100]|uniref:hypothetical protein n=1 Tax=Calothrix sp. NIES-2100 TaxID=1954172 RepID=UPI000B5EA239|nr:hypothetical protein NIES2100_05050 [Calothrix sp. NIES-2100]